MTSAGFLVLPSRERLEALLDYGVQGAWPPDGCTECRGRADGWCEPCAQLDADRDAMNRALVRVQAAATDDEARAALIDCLAELAATPGDQNGQPTLPAGRAECTASANATHHTQGVHQP